MYESSCEIRVGKSCCFKQTWKYALPFTSVFLYTGLKVDGVFLSLYIYVCICVYRIVHILVATVGSLFPAMSSSSISAGVTFSLLRNRASFRAFLSAEKRKSPIFTNTMVRGIAMIDDNIKNTHTTKAHAGYWRGTDLPYKVNDKEIL